MAKEMSHVVTPTVQPPVHTVVNYGYLWTYTGNHKLTRNLKKALMIFVNELEFSWSASKSVFYRCKNIIKTHKYRSN